MTAEQPRITPADFNAVKEFLHRTTGIALSEGKLQMVQSRLQKRLRQHGSPDFATYLRFAFEDAGERVDLINSLTTNKTDFFRENHHFDFLADRFFPEMIAENKAGARPRALRVWHAGCSTGEEPYTMAMTVAESPLADWDVRLLASDIDTNVLDHARAGIYDEDRLEPIPMDRRRAHFLRGKGSRDGSYRVRADLRDMISFRQINLLDDPWPIRSDVKFDIIFCRNVVIYFDRPTQTRLFTRFGQKLRPGGLLIIGHSENLHGLSDQFEALGYTIFRLPQHGAGALRRAA